MNRTFSLDIGSTTQHSLSSNPQPLLRDSSLQHFWRKEQQQQEEKQMQISSAAAAVDCTTTSGRPTTAHPLNQSNTSCAARKNYHLDNNRVGGDISSNRGGVSTGERFTLKSIFDRTSIISGSSSTLCPTGKQLFPPDKNKTGGLGVVPNSSDDEYLFPLRIYSPSAEIIFQRGLDYARNKMVQHFFNTSSSSPHNNSGGGLNADSMVRLSKDLEAPLTASIGRIGFELKSSVEKYLRREAKAVIAKECKQRHLPLEKHPLSSRLAALAEEYKLAQRIQTAEGAQPLFLLRDSKSDKISQHHICWFWISVQGAEALSEALHSIKATVERDRVTFLAAGQQELGGGGQDAASRAKEIEVAKVRKLRQFQLWLLLIQFLQEHLESHHESYFLEGSEDLFLLEPLPLKAKGVLRQVKEEAVGVGATTSPSVKRLTETFEGRLAQQQVEETPKFLPVALCPTHDRPAVLDLPQEQQELLVTTNQQQKTSNLISGLPEKSIGGPAAPQPLLTTKSVSSIAVVPKMLTDLPKLKTTMPAAVISLIKNTLHAFRSSWQRVQHLTFSNEVSRGLALRRLVVPHSSNSSDCDDSISPSGKTVTDLKRDPKEDASCPHDEHPALRLDVSDESDSLSTYFRKLQTVCSHVRISDNTHQQTCSNHPPSNFPGGSRQGNGTAVPPSATRKAPLPLTSSARGGRGATAAVRRGRGGRSNFTRHRRNRSDDDDSSSEDDTTTTDSSEEDTDTTSSDDETTSSEETSSDDFSTTESESSVSTPHRRRNARGRGRGSARR